MNKYEDVGVEAGRLPQDLKRFGTGRSAADFWGALVGIAGAFTLIGFVVGFLWR